MLGRKTDVLGFGIDRGGFYPSGIAGGLPMAPSFTGFDNIRMEPNKKPMLQEAREVPYKSFSMPQPNVNSISDTRNIFLDGGLSAIPRLGLWAGMKFNQ